MSNAGSCAEPVDIVGVKPRRFLRINRATRYEWEGNESRVNAGIRTKTVGFIPSASRLPK